MRPINWIILHCSDSDVSAHDKIETIRQWHMGERNFSDVGYHFFIQKNGVTVKGGDEVKVGAHVMGHNKDSIGICLSGKHDFTAAQFKSLEILLIELCGKYELEKMDILGHSDLDGKKTCPNFDVTKWLSSLNWH